MKPASFDLFQPLDWSETLNALKNYGKDAKILAGGQSLIAMMNMRIAKPKVLIDINTIKDDIDLIDHRDTIEIGPLYRQLELEIRHQTKKDLPLIAQCLPYIGHQQHRARGTVIGSLCHADPSSEIPLCFLALKGKVKLRNYSSQRIINAEDFFLGPLLTSKKDNEIVASVIFPKATKNTGYAFKEISEKYGDFAMASFAAIAKENHVRFVVGGVCDNFTAIEWQTNNLKEINKSLNDFAWDLNTITDHYTSARYKREIVRNLGLKTIELAIKRMDMN